MMRLRHLLLSGAVLCAISLPAHAAENYGIAMHGDLKYPSSFKNFSYVNPDAPKGGTLRLSASGTFDSLNPFILKGQSAAGLNALGQGLIYESLMTQSADEPFSMYGLIAQAIDVPDDRSRVTFHINPAAKWNDGTPITADDVVWTFNALMQHGSPFFKAYFGDVVTVTADDKSRATFTIKNPQNRELPLVLAQMVVLPKHYWTSPERDIAKGDLRAPVSSGPYKIETIKPGAQIAYVRDPNWWGKDLAVNRGRYNFDRITYDYYRDENVSLEAFFAGRYDVRSEMVSKLWTSAYTVPAVRDGRITKEEIAHSQPVGMQAFAFNTRRPVFSDPRVRRALATAFDFEWANKQLAAGVYNRTSSFFENSDLASSGLPEGKERDILEKFRGRIPDEIFTTPFSPSKTDGSGNNRDNMKRAADMLDAAGYKIGKDGIRANDKGVRLSFEYIDENPALERWSAPFLQSLRKIGIEARQRIIDPTQYQNRMNDYDFDMTMLVFPQSDSPGNEQRDFWSSSKANIKGSRNYMGVRDPVVDELTEMIIAAQTREDLVAATRAMDRVLLAGNYVIPGWNYTKWRVAWWRGFERPKNEGTKSLGVTDEWWKKE